MDNKANFLQSDANISFRGEKSPFVNVSADNVSSGKKYVVSSKNMAAHPHPAKTESLTSQEQNTTATLFGVNDDLDTSLSLVHEISEITAAFLADEEISRSFDAPDWLKMYVTSPSIIQDNLSDHSSIVCYENEVSKTEQASPVLGISDRFVKESRPINKLIKENENLLTLHHISTPRFRPPFNTSTPNNENVKTLTDKRKSKSSFYAPFSKRQKLFCSSATEQGSSRVNPNIIEMRQKASEQQQHLAEHGKQNTSVVCCKGSHLLRRQTESGIPLQTFLNGQPPKQMPVDEVSIEK